MTNNNVLSKNEKSAMTYNNFEDVRASKMINRANKIVEMNNLLSENKISSENDLESFKLTIQNNISKLRDTKENLVTSVRKSENFDDKAQEILELNKQIDIINKKLKTINFIEYELKKIKATKLVLEREKENTRVKIEQEKMIKKLRDKNAR